MDSGGNNVYDVTVEVSDGNGGTDSQAITVTVILHIVDEDDYEAYANGSGSPFPPEASSQDRAFDTDYDGDGQINGEEYAAGSNPNDPDDYFWSIAGYDPEQGFKVVFCPYLPDKNEYTLMGAFGGSNNDESTSLSFTAQPYEGDPTMGCFIVPPSQGVLEDLLIFINTLKTSL